MITRAISRPTLDPALYDQALQEGPPAGDPILSTYTNDWWNDLSQVSEGFRSIKDCLDVYISDRQPPPGEEHLLAQDTPLCGIDRNSLSLAMSSAVPLSKELEVFQAGLRDELVALEEEIFVASDGAMLRSPPFTSLFPHFSFPFRI